jgi:hypothetical protein
MVVEQSVEGSGLRTLGTVPATGDDGFAMLLGDWTCTVPYLRTNDIYVDPDSLD